MIFLRVFLFGLIVKNNNNNESRFNLQFKLNLAYLKQNILVLIKRDLYPFNENFFKSCTNIIILHIIEFKMFKYIHTRIIIIS